MGDKNKINICEVETIQGQVADMGHWGKSEEEALVTKRPNSLLFQNLPLSTEGVHGNPLSHCPMGF